jgi:hypothetical protein
LAAVPVPSPDLDGLNASADVSIAVFLLADAEMLLATTPKPDMTVGLGGGPDFILTTNDSAEFRAAVLKSREDTARHLAQAKVINEITIHLHDLTIYSHFLENDIHQLIHYSTEAKKRNWVLAIEGSELSPVTKTNLLQEIKF